MKSYLLAFLMLLAMWGVALEALGSDRLPPPGCYDYHGCGVDEMSEEEYNRAWQEYGYATPPDDYAHHEDHTLVRYGDSVYSKKTSDEDDEEWVGGYPLQGDLEPCVWDLKIITYDTCRNCFSVSIGPYESSNCPDY